VLVTGHWPATHDCTLTAEPAYNGDGVRTSKTVSGDTSQYVLDLAASLPVVVSDTKAVYLYGLDSVRHPSTGLRAGLLDSTGDPEANYAYGPFGVPVVAGATSGALVIMTILCTTTLPVRGSVRFSAPF
jgi:hypothetical protein